MDTFIPEGSPDEGEVPYGGHLDSLCGTSPTEMT